MTSSWKLRVAVLLVGLALAAAGGALNLFACGWSW
jgi:hypothetical protein